MRALVLVVVVLAGTTSVRAQPAPTPPSSAPPGMSGSAPRALYYPPPASPAPTKPPAAICLIGRALPYCTNVLLAEMSVSLRSDGAWSGYLEGGLLVNQGHHNAWGISMGLVDTEPPLLRPIVTEDVEGQHKFFVVHARYRRWLTDWLGVDASLGGGRFGPDAQAAIEIGDAIAIVAGASEVPDPTGGKLAASIGVRLGAPALLLLLALLTNTNVGGGTD